jgi:iron complex transport system substrate-binding protein
MRISNPKKIVHSIMYKSLKLYLIVILFLLSGCNKENSPPKSSSNCPIISHENGDTPICQTPKQVVALSPYVLDLLLSLDIQPVGYSGYSAFTSKVFDNPTAQIPYIGDKLTSQPINIGDRHNPSLETLIMIKPEVIIGEYWQGNDKYPLLSQIAPTILVNEEKGGWRRDLMTVAKVFNRETQAQNTIALRDNNIISARQQLSSIVASHPRILLLSSGSIIDGFYDYGTRETIYSHLLKSIGFEIVTLKQSNQNINEKVSLEAIPDIDTDIIMVIAWDIDKNNLNLWQQREKEWRNNPILNNLDVFKRGRVYFLDGHLTMVRGAMAEDIILLEMISLLQEKKYN